MSAPPLKRIMVVDSLMDISPIGRVLLAAEGFDISVMPDPMEALKAAEKDWPDFVVIDDSMSGFCSTDEWVAMMRNKNIPSVLIVTGTDNPEDSAHRLNVQHWFKKPFDFKALLAVLKSSGHAA
ncbi:MAG TPA: response regulator [Planctomycetota bacterium]|nr:response regulator [Planctomycetota bacterium]